MRDPYKIDINAISKETVDTLLELDSATEKRIQAIAARDKARISRGESAPDTSDVPNLSNLGTANKEKKDAKTEKLLKKVTKNVKPASEKESGEAAEAHGDTNESISFKEYLSEIKKGKERLKTATAKLGKEPLGAGEKTALKKRYAKKPGRLEQDADTHGSDYVGSQVYDNKVAESWSDKPFPDDWKDTHIARQRRAINRKTWKKSHPKEWAKAEQGKHKVGDAPGIEWDDDDRAEGYGSSKANEQVDKLSQFNPDIDENPLEKATKLRKKHVEKHGNTPVVAQGNARTRRRAGKSVTEAGVQRLKRVGASLDKKHGKAMDAAYDWSIPGESPENRDVRLGSAKKEADEIQKQRVANAGRLGRKQGEGAGRPLSRKIKALNNG